MLRLLGSAKTLCDGWTRRDMLQAGTLSLLGLGLEGIARLAEAATVPASPGASFGKAKSCILLYLFGAPSQLEWCDMKPAAPVEIRGELKPIRSRLPGCDVCEHLPRMAGVMDRVAVVRSMTHPHPEHSVSFSLTDLPRAQFDLDVNPRSPRHAPFIGSVVDYLTRKEGGASSGVPPNIGLPFAFGSRRPGVRYAGFQPAFLGGEYAPVWAEFRGRATGHVLRPPIATGIRYEGEDPYLGIAPDGHFDLAGEVALPAEVTLDRLDRRRSLLAQLDAGRQDIDRSVAGRALNGQRQAALSLLTSGKVRDALDLRKEPLPLREIYGMNLFGQSALMARRLVEAGCRFVTSVWDDFGTIGTAWDTHINHFERMQGELLPGLDRAFAALIADLEERGLLDETLVICMGEHGRTPLLVKDRPGGGRDHWSRAYTALFAGGGVARGRVVGRTDKTAGDVLERPVSPKDVLATVYHLLGIAPETTLTNRVGQPVPLVSEGKVVHELLG